MIQTITDDKTAVSIPLLMPAGIGWDIMREIIEVDMLLKAALVAENRESALNDVAASRDILNDVAYQLSYILLPRFGREMAEAGMAEVHEKEGGGGSP